MRKGNSLVSILVFTRKTLIFYGMGGNNYSLVQLAREGISSQVLITKI